MHSLEEKRLFNGTSSVFPSDEVMYILEEQPKNRLRDSAVVMIISSSFWATARKEVQASMHSSPNRHLDFMIRVVFWIFIGKKTDKKAFF
jgi:hypothetical protein